jgi:hypothetical protein
MDVSSPSSLRYRSPTICIFLVDSCPGGKSEFLFEIDMSKTKDSLVELQEATLLKSISFKEHLAFPENILFHSISKAEL